MGPRSQRAVQTRQDENGKAPTEATSKPSSTRAATAMPAFSDMLSDDERNDVLAYLKTL